jgi:hypothetical protein
MSAIRFIWAVIRAAWAFALALPALSEVYRCTRWKRDLEEDRLERLRHPERFSVR